MIATTIGGSTIGTRKPVRSASSQRDGLSSSSARPRPTAICATTVTTDNSTCNQTERMNSRSRERLRVVLPRIGEIERDTGL